MSGSPEGLPSQLVDLDALGFYACSIAIVDVAANRFGLLDLDRLALQDGVNRVAEKLLLDLAFVGRAVVHRAGIADGLVLVDDEELRGVAGPVGLANLLAVVVAVNEVITLALYTLADGRQLVLRLVFDTDGNHL